MKGKKLSAAKEAATKADVTSEDQAEDPQGGETVTAIIPEKPAAQPVRAAPKPAAKRPAARTTNATRFRRAEVQTNKARK